MSYKCIYVAALAFISAFVPLPGAIANLCGMSFEVLLAWAVIPMLVVVSMGIVCTPISLCLIIHAIWSNQLKEVVLLFVSLSFPLAIFYAVRLLNAPGFEGVMSV